MRRSPSCEKPEQVSNQRAWLRDTGPRRTWAFLDAVKQDVACARFRLIPLDVQLGAGLTCSASLGTEEDVHIKSRFAFEHIIDRPCQLVGQEAQGFAFVMFFL